MPQRILLPVLLLFLRGQRRRSSYLPAGRGTYGHPVLSMYQTDIIVYGSDLADCIDNELARQHPIPADWTPPPLVPFWSEFV